MTDNWFKCWVVSLTTILNLLNTTFHSNQNLLFRYSCLALIVGYISHKPHRLGGSIPGTLQPIQNWKSVLDMKCLQDHNSTCSNSVKEYSVHGNALNNLSNVAKDIYALMRWCRRTDIKKVTSKRHGNTYRMWLIWSQNSFISSENGALYSGGRGEEAFTTIPNSKQT